MRIRSLSRYPVKSLQGESLQEAVLTDRGLLGDRGYALVDVEDGLVASAKHPRKWGGLLDLTARYVEEPELGRELPPVEVTLPDGTRLRSDDPATDAALSRVLGRPVRLTDVAPDKGRFEEQWPAIEGLAPADVITSTTTSYEGEEPVSAFDLGMLAPSGTFFDLAPLHLLTTSTLAELTSRAPESDFAPRRYRPNVLIEGADDGFAEDAWVGREVGLGEVRAAASMLTMRCVMTTLAQPGLAEDRDTLRTVARHHREEIPGLGTWACAGVYAGVATGGRVTVGDPVTVG